MLCRPGLLLCGLPLLLTACETIPGPQGADTLDISPGEIAAIIERHNGRVDLLQQLYATGVMEYRWIDDKGGEHFHPQINSRIWLDLPRHSAVQGEKIERLFWIGSDDEQYWIFDLMDDPATLYIGQHDTAHRQDAPLLVHPLALIDLLGLTPLAVPGEEDVADDPLVEVAGNSFTVTAQGAGGPMRVEFSAGGQLIGVETLDIDGQVLLRSELSDHRSVYVGGIARTALPRLPRDIRISDLNRTLQVFFALGDASDGASQPWDRVFDLDRLTSHLRPDRVEQLREIASGSPAPDSR